MANLVKFYTCEKASDYASKYSEFQGGICFAKDTQEIYLDGTSYGSGNLSNEVLENLSKLNNAFVALSYTESTGGRDIDGNFTFEFFNSNDEYVASIYLPVVTKTTSGVMSATDKEKLDSIDVNKLVLQEEGKGLSSNDYTDSEKEKLETISEGAQVNTIETIEIDGVALSITDKTVDIDLEDRVNEIVGDKISRAYVYRGSVDSLEELAEKEATANVGDVYNITIATDEYGPAGVNVAWKEEEDGSSGWDTLGGIFSTTDITGDIEALELDIIDVSDRVSDLENLGIEAKLGDLQEDIDTLNGDADTSGSVTNIATTIIDGRLTWETIQ